MATETELLTLQLTLATIFGGIYVTSLAVASLKIVFEKAYKGISLNEAVVTRLRETNRSGWRKSGSCTLGEGIAFGSFSADISMLIAVYQDKQVFADALKTTMLLLAVGHITLYSIILMISAWLDKYYMLNSSDSPNVKIVRGASPLIIAILSVIGAWLVVPYAVTWIYLGITSVFS
jgi:hypothetical protein